MMFGRRIENYLHWNTGAGKEFWLYTNRVLIDRSALRGSRKHLPRP